MIYVNDGRRQHLFSARAPHGPTIYNQKTAQFLNRIDMTPVPYHRVLRTLRTTTSIAASAAEWGVITLADCSYPYPARRIGLPRRQPEGPQKHPSIVRRHRLHPGRAGHCSATTTTATAPLHSSNVVGPEESTGIAPKDLYALRLDLIRIVFSPHDPDRLCRRQRVFPKQD